MVRKKNTAQIKIHKASLPGQLLIVCGEHSGDLLGSDLIRELKIHLPKLDFWGVGGDTMIQEGFQTIENIEKMNVVGFNGILFKYRFLKALLNRIVRTAIEKKCEYAVLIDYPGFNLRLAEQLKANGIKVIFYVSPQIWAWNFKRIHFIKKNIDLMLTLFGFEKKIYDEYNVKAEFVGHPIAQRIREKLEKEEKIVKTDSITITLMPGSRSSEIRMMTGEILKSAFQLDEIYSRKKKKIRFLFPNINKNQEAFIISEIGKIKSKNPEIIIDYFFDNSLRAMQISDLVILSSGTATLEGTYLEKPMIILYKVGFLTYFIASRLINTPYLGLINVLSGNETCRELIQAECKADYIVEEAINILDNTKYRNSMIEKIKEVKESLGSSNASRKAVRAILKLMDHQD